MSPILRQSSLVILRENLVHILMVNLAALGEKHYGFLEVCFPCYVKKFVKDYGLRQ